MAKFIKWHRVKRLGNGGTFDRYKFYTAAGWRLQRDLVNLVGVTPSYHGLARQAKTPRLKFSFVDEAQRNAAHSRLVLGESVIRDAHKIAELSFERCEGLIRRASTSHSVFYINVRVRDDESEEMSVQDFISACEVFITREAHQIRPAKNKTTVVWQFDEGANISDFSVLFDYCEDVLRIDRPALEKKTVLCLCNLGEVVTRESLQHCLQVAREDAPRHRFQIYIERLLADYDAVATLQYESHYRFVKACTEVRVTHVHKSDKGG